MTQCPRGEQSEQTGENAPAASQAGPGGVDWQPGRLVRTCVATTRDSEEFGRLVGAEAKARNFEAAGRRAFVGDGQAYNWAIQKRWFADYTPVADFIHVLGYAWQAASAAGGSEAEQWDRYARWMRGCWQGRVSEVIIELSGECERLGPAPEDAEPTDPRVVLERVRGYLGNNADRMAYPEYRKSGLPVTSSWVESLIKEVNYRVKGTEKFWNAAGAESVLQVRAAVLSDDDRLAKHLTGRPGCPFHRRTTAAA
jgi:hypothetical protein